MLANKSDLPEARDAESLGEFFALSSQKDNGRVAFIHSVSAKTGDGIKEALEHLAKAVKEGQHKKEKKADE